MPVAARRPMTSSPAGELAALKAQQAALQAEVDALRALVERLYAELGVGTT